MARPMSRPWNFGAGPATLPEPVLERVRDQIMSIPGLGISPLEISHRSSWFEGVIREAEASVLFALFAPSGIGSVPGLYGGMVVHSGITVRLVQYTDVPGLSLDGTLTIVFGAGPLLRFKGTVSVSGPRATPLTFSIA